jgi:hypothetical protein
MTQDIGKLLTDEQRAALERGEEVEIAIVPGPGKSLSPEQRSQLDLELSPENARLAEALPADRKATVRERLLELVNANIMITNERVRAACLMTRPQWKAAVETYRD